MPSDRIEAIDKAIVNIANVIADTPIRHYKPDSTEIYLGSHEVLDAAKAVLSLAQAKALLLQITGPDDHRGPF